MRAGDLRPNPRNWRLHSETQRRALAAVLNEVGFAGAVLVRETAEGLELIDGHLRAGEDPEQIVPALVLDVDEAEANTLLATFDPIGRLATSDETALGALLDSVALDPDLQTALFPAGAVKPGKVDPDTLPTEAKMRVALGDVWELGEHRLVCGDATSAEDWRRLMGRAKAAVVWTDPPYGVAYTDPTGKWDPIAGDELQRDALVKLIGPAFALAVKYSAPTAAFYIWHASGPPRQDFLFAMGQAGLEERQDLVWVKPPVNHVGGARRWMHYAWAHEACFYAARSGEQPAWYGVTPKNPTTFSVAVPAPEGPAMALGRRGVLVSDGAGAEIFLAPKAPDNHRSKLRHQRLAEGEHLRVVNDHGGTSTVFDVGREHGAIHPTQKPTEIARMTLRNSSQPGEIVADPFGGSGTTLIAAEQLGRRARLLELDPGYCSAILARWEAFTGAEARKA